MNDLIHMTVCYSPSSIAGVRSHSQTDKAHLLALAKQRKRSRTKKSIKATLEMGLAIITFAAAAFLYLDHISTCNAVGEEISDTYISQLGTIIDRYSEAELLDLANQTLSAIGSSNKAEEQVDAQNIKDILNRIEELKAKGMLQEAGWQWENIVAIASKSNHFLPGYSFDKKSIVGGIVADVEGFFKKN